MIDRKKLDSAMESIRESEAEARTYVDTLKKLNQMNISLIDLKGEELKVAKDYNRTLEKAKEETKKGIKEKIKTAQRRVSSKLGKTYKDMSGDEAIDVGQAQSHLNVLQKAKETMDKITGGGGSGGGGDRRQNSPFSALQSAYFLSHGMAGKIGGAIGIGAAAIAGKNMNRWGTVGTTAGNVVSSILDLGKDYKAQIPHRLKIYPRTDITENEVSSRFISRGAQLGYRPEETTGITAALSGHGSGVAESSNLVQAMTRVGIEADTAAGMAVSIRTGGIQGAGVKKTLGGVSDLMVTAALTDAINKSDLPKSMDELKNLMEKYMPTGASAEGMADMFLKYSSKNGYLSTPGRVGSLMDSFLSKTQQEFDPYIQALAINPLIEKYGGGREYGLGKRRQMQAAMGDSLEKMSPRERADWEPILKAREEAGLGKVSTPMEAMIDELMGSMDDFEDSIEDATMFLTDLSKILPPDQFRAMAALFDKRKTELYKKKLMSIPGITEPLADKIMKMSSEGEMALTDTQMEELLQGNVGKPSKQIRTFFKSAFLGMNAHNASADGGYMYPGPFGPEYIPNAPRSKTWGQVDLDNPEVKKRAEEASDKIKFKEWNEKTKKILEESPNLVWPSDDATKERFLNQSSWMSEKNAKILAKCGGVVTGAAVRPTFLGVKGQPIDSSHIDPEAAFPDMGLTPEQLSCYEQENVKMKWNRTHYHGWSEPDASNNESSSTENTKLLKKISDNTGACQLTNGIQECNIAD